MKIISREVVNEFCRSGCETVCVQMDQFDI